MEYKFIGREFEFTQLDRLIKTKSSNRFTLQAESGLGKSTFLREVARKYTHQQIFIDANDLALVETASEFLIYLAVKAQGFAHFKRVVQQLHLSEQLKPESEHLLLEALVNDCKQPTMLLVDNYHVLFSKTQLLEPKIACYYNNLSQWSLTQNNHSPKYQHEMPSLKDWLLQLLDFLQKHSALLITAREPQVHLCSDAIELRRFNKQEVLSFIEQPEFLELHSLIKENQATILEVLIQLSYGGEVLWLRLAIYFLIKEIKQGRTLVDFILMENLKDAFIHSSHHYKNLDYDDEQMHKIALLKAEILQQDEVWLVALPRHLDIEMFRALFAEEAENICQQFLNNGLIIERYQENKQCYCLHEELRNLLLTYAHSKLDTDRIKSLYRLLASVFQHRYDQCKKPQLLVDKYYYHLMAGDEEQLTNIDEPFLLVALANIFEQEQQHAKLSYVFLRLLEIAPEYENIWFGLGIALFKQGRLEEAVTAYKKQLLLEPAHQRAWKNLGFTLNQQGKIEEAVSAYQKKLPLKDASPVIKPTESAEQTLLRRKVLYYQAELKFSINHPSAWFNLGMSLKKLQRWDEAVKALRRHVMIEEKDEAAWNNLGISLYQQGELTAAADAFLMAIKINPQHLYALMNDAELALIQNDKKRCADNLQQAYPLINPQLEDFVLLPFLNWLNRPESSPQSILNAIKKLDNKVEFLWKCTDIAPVIERLSPHKKKIAQIFMGYFNPEKDLLLLIKNLKRELKV